MSPENLRAEQDNRPDKSDQPSRFVVDANKSLFTVQAFASGIASVVAHSPKFAIRGVDGHAQFLSSKLERASLVMNIDLASLEIMDDVTKQDRREIERVMFDEVLEKNRYPKAEYLSSDAVAVKTAENTFRVNVTGKLSLHGTTRGVTLEVSVVLGEDTLRAQGNFVLSQAEYGIRTVSVAGGSVQLKDELKFSYFILAHRQN